jgi:hypothetical protein
MISFTRDRLGVTGVLVRGIRDPRLRLFFVKEDEKPSVVNGDSGGLDGFGEDVCCGM